MGEGVGMVLTMVFKPNFDVPGCPVHKKKIKMRAI